MSNERQPQRFRIHATEIPENIDWIHYLTEHHQRHVAQAKTIVIRSLRTSGTIVLTRPDGSQFFLSPEDAEPRSSMPTCSFIDWVMTPTIAKDARANLDDVSEGWVARYGVAKAKRLYRWQSFRLVVRYVFDHLISSLGQLRSIIGG